MNKSVCRYYDNEYLQSTAMYWCLDALMRMRHETQWLRRENIINVAQEYAPEQIHKFLDSMREDWAWIPAWIDQNQSYEILREYMVWSIMEKKRRGERTRGQC